LDGLIWQLGLDECDTKAVEFVADEGFGSNLWQKLHDCCYVFDIMQCKMYSICSKSLGCSIASRSRVLLALQPLTSFAAEVTRLVEQTKAHVVVRLLLLLFLLLRLSSLWRCITTSSRSRSSSTTGSSTARWDGGELG